MVALALRQLTPAEFVKWRETYQPSMAGASLLISVIAQIIFCI